MNYRDYKRNVEKETARLSQSEKVALCLICCKRLAPLYTEFQRIENWGDEAILSKIRDKALAWLDGSREDFSDFGAQLESHIPDMDDFGSLLGSFALNAGVSHLDLIDQVGTDDSQPVVDGLQMCYETVDFCVQEQLHHDSTARATDSQIENHEIMLLEIDWQIEEINSLKSRQDLSQFVVGRSGEPRVSAFIAETVMPKP